MATATKRAPAPKKAAQAARRETKIQVAEERDDDLELMPITFTWEGQEYEIDPDFKDDVEILEEIEDQNTIRAVRRILGVDQWEQWKDANRGRNGRVSGATAESFLQTMFEELGQGN